MKMVTKVPSSICLFLFCLFFFAAYSEGSSRPITEAEWIGDLVFNNECTRKASNLVIWNKGENFPSLGIGHFIWYPASFSGPFDESFPKLVVFLESKGSVIPDNLKWILSKHAPWETREEFIRAASGPEMAALRGFLEHTQNYQAEFIADRVVKSLPRILATVPLNSRKDIRKKLELIIDAKGGLYPLIDYVNLNGEGILPSERYHGQGWGLLQVLEEMKTPEAEKDAIREFVRAAGIILERRVANAPPERHERRWLAGWKARIHTYLNKQYRCDACADHSLSNALSSSFFGDTPK